MEANMHSMLFFCMVNLVIFPTLRANIAEFDDFWKQQSQEAKHAARQAFKPNPHHITNDFNHHVHKSWEGSNSTRRGLKRDVGPCMATNPIDKCWRCDPNWAKNRMKLADCALGFGKGTTGGKGGKIYVVTDPSDNDLVNPKPGTLRHAVIQSEPLWIIFKHDMVIRLSEELMVTSNKTIDARGANIQVRNSAQITLQYVRNIIIHGLHIHESKRGQGGLIRDSLIHHGYRSQSDGDGISMFGATNVWIDHVSMSHCSDGLIDAVMESTAITVSNCHFTNHDDVMLFGATDGYTADEVMQITVAFNHFGKGLVQRMPRCRYGFFHVVNNDYTHWRMYAIGGSQHPTILSHGNRYIAPPDKNSKEVTKRDYAAEGVWRSWIWRSEGDLMLNGAFFIQSGSRTAALPKSDGISAKPGSFVSTLTRFAGALTCKENKPC